MIYYTDVRLKQLFDVSYEIYFKNLEWSVAELGVFTREFEKYINKFFYDRKLYLFDTYEGFPDENINSDEFYKNEKFLKDNWNKQITHSLEDL